MKKDADNYLDDFLFTALIASMCDAQVEVFLSICEQIRFPVSLDKTVWSCQLLTFLGFLINTIEQKISVPLEKVEKAVEQLLDVCSNRKTTVLKTQNLTGLLNFLCRAIVPGRAFTRRFYAKIAKPKLKQHHHVEVDSEMKLDAQVWLRFLETPDNTAICRPFIDFNQVLITDRLKFYTDASGAAHLGFRAFFRGFWTYRRWKENLIKELSPSIEYLELYTLTVGIVLWAPRLKNKRVIVFCDNQAVVQMVNKYTAGCINCMHLIRLIVFTSLKHNVRFFTKYVDTHQNVLADALSRQDLTRFIETCSFLYTPQTRKNS